MRLLLDTHVALWAIADDSHLAPEARELIANPRHDVFVSAASVWEISIKRSLSKRDMPLSGQQALDWFRDSGYDILPVLGEHAAAVERLPKIHADPFDRLIVAQAITEPLRLLTHDKQVAAYSDSIQLV